MYKLHGSLDFILKMEPRPKMPYEPFVRLADKSGASEANVV